MNQQEYNQLRETGWCRPLTPSEQAELQKYLAAHPVDREDWQAETELNRLLEKLPEAPKVSSNFTARVLKVVELEAAARARERAASPWSRNIRGWLPRFGVAGLVIVSLVAGYHHREASERAALARNVAGLTEAVSLNPELMKDIEPISRLSDSRSAADTELIALMK
jgi:anti-sigma factor RsiW